MAEVARPGFKPDALTPVRDVMDNDDHARHPSTYNPVSPPLVVYRLAGWSGQLPVPLGSAGGQETDFRSAGIPAGIPGIPAGIQKDPIVENPSVPDFLPIINVLKCTKALTLNQVAIDWLQWLCLCFTLRPWSISKLIVAIKLNKVDDVAPKNGVR